MSMFVTEHFASTNSWNSMLPCASDVRLERHVYNNNNNRKQAQAQQRRVLRDESSLYADDRESITLWYVKRTENIVVRYMAEANAGSRRFKTKPEIDASL